MMKNIFGIIALALSIAACNQKIDANEEYIQDPHWITITATIAPKTPLTRALADPGDGTLRAYWEENEHIAVLYEANSVKYAADAEVKSVDGATGAATVEFTVVSGTSDSTPCTLVYPFTAANAEHTGVKDFCSIFGTQNGTLSQNLDVRVGEGVIQLSSRDLELVAPLTSQFTVFKFTLTDGTNAIDATNLDIKTESDELITTIIPSSASNVMYAALPAASSGTEYHFVANDGSISYTKNIYLNKGTMAGFYYRTTLVLIPDDIFTNANLVSISETIQPDLTIKQGFVSQKADTVRVMREGRPIGAVILSEPVVVAQADEEEPWGYFQFPCISRTENNNVIVSWSMREDSHTAYGDNVSFGRRMSKDEGIHWEPWDELYYRKSRFGVDLPNGNYLQIYIPESKDIRTYSNFPEPINDTPINGYQFFSESELPEDLKGVYFEVWDKDKCQVNIEHCNLNDPGLLRYAINSIMPVYWRGDLKMLKDNTLLAGVYGPFYQNINGSINNRGVSFYKSVDNGYNWDLTGKIPFNIGSLAYEGGEGFCEPTFEILKDGSWLCVMRTGHFAPLYRSFSMDYGVNWTTPEPFTSNGVNPSLALLNNGVLCLSSGRPGLQLRFSFDGSGMNWTEPIEMFPFLDENGKYSTDVYRGVSCGYAELLIVNDNTFYIVYSDFNTRNENGEKRKSIIFRKIVTLPNPR